jgi:hypothetical protein
LIRGRRLENQRLKLSDRMNEAFDDEKLYSEERQCDDLIIRNYKEVLQKYSYRDYVERFRLLAKKNELSPEQRPKLDANEFSSRIKKLVDTILNSREENLFKFNNEKRKKIAFKLLISDFLEEDWLCSFERLRLKPYG